ncbi:MAG: ComEA family DNA-binding protein [Bacteroidota bacterium]
MRFRIFIRKYFTFNKRERNGLIFLLSVIFLLLISAVLIRSKESKIDITFESPIMDTLSVERENKFISSKNKKVISVNQNLHLFVFDPNTVTNDEAIQLGFTPKTTKVLLNFRSKGGRFKEKKDLKKIYGVSEKLFLTLEPYILIADNSNKEDNVVNQIKQKSNINNKLVELNSADSFQLVALNGIGPKLSSRILIYRKSLGGFYDVNQLKEIYGMKDSLFQLFVQRIEIDPAKINKIKINSINLEELRKHAYLKFIVAQSIINYRQKHGSLKSEQDLIKVGSLSDELIKKLRPYIEYD